MRVLLVIFALLLLPVLALIHRSHFVRVMQGQLLAQVKTALADPDFNHVRNDPGTTMDHLDVILSGTVSDISLRERARKEVNGIRGVRCRDEDNHIRVPAGIEGSLDGEVMHLTGWLHDDATLQDLALWLSEGRPGLQVDTTKVKISPYVASEESPRRVKSPLFQPLWSMIEVPTKIDIVKKDDSVLITGALPNQQVKAVVIRSVLGTRVETTLDAHDLKVGAYVKAAPFTAKPVDLESLLNALFESQDKTVFHADADTISFTADVTDEQYAAWQPLILALGGEKVVTPTWRFHPSSYHLPGYKPISKLPEDVLQTLKSALIQGVIKFSATSAEISEDQMGALKACALAVHAASSLSPDLRIVVGAHPEPGGTSKAAQILARHRAEAVVDELVDRSLAERLFEIVSFSPPHPGDAEGAAHSNTVEMFVK